MKKIINMVIFVLCISLSCIAASSGYDFVGEYNEYGVALVKQGTKWGMIARDGAVKVPIAYDEIGVFKNGEASLVKGKNSGLVHASGRVIAEPKYVTVYPANSQGIRIALIKKQSGAEEMSTSHTYAILNKDGKVLIDKAYGGAISVFKPMAGLQSWVDKGQDTLNTLSSYIVHSLGINKMQVLDLDGNVVIDEAVRTRILQEYLGPKASAKKSTLFYPAIESLVSEDVFVFYYCQPSGSELKVLYGYYDAMAKKVIKAYEYSGAKLQLTTVMTQISQLSPFQEGFAVVNHESIKPYTELLDRKGRTVGEYAYGGCLPYQYGYAAVKGDNGLWGVMDTKQELVIPYAYESLQSSLSITGDVVMVAQQDKQQGVINLNNEEIVPLNYKQVILQPKTNLAYVKGERKWGVYDGSKQILPCSYDSIRAYSWGSFLCYQYPSVMVYCEESAMLSEPFRGFKDRVVADGDLHNGVLWEMYKIHGKDTVYGAVNGYTQEVLPFVFTSQSALDKAAHKYAGLPVKEFNELDRLRLYLDNSRRERVYQLDGIVPNKEWDY